MASADVPEEKQKYVKALQEAWDGLVTAANGGPDEGWQDLGTSKGVKGMKKKSSGSIGQVKGTCVIKAPAELILDWCEDRDKCKQWDEDINTNVLVEEIAPHVNIELWTYKAQWPTSARDFCVVTGHQKRDDGTWVLGEQSVEHPGAPEVKGNVRGVITSSGFVLKPVKDEENTFEVTYVNQLDPKGSLPTALMNKLNEAAPDCLVKIRELTEKAHSGN